jgi:hypothetical protein
VARLRFPLRAALAAPFLTIASCSASGSKLHPVRGTVLYLDQPAAGAVVVFQPLNSGPESVVPSATAGPDGNFSLRTPPHGDGAPAGEYVVVVTWYPPDAREQDKPPARYGNPADSPLRATVRAGPNQLEPFRLTK